MSEHDEPTLDDVIVPEEHAVPDHHQHAKGYDRPNDDELERRTEHERIQAGLDEYDPNEVPSATE
jgi:hypothetical protein